MENHLDSEWTQLVKDAMSSGVSKEQFREFLEFTKWKQDQKIIERSAYKPHFFFLQKSEESRFLIYYLSSPSA